MRCMWFSERPMLILQVTGLYDYRFPFCSWCNGVRGLSRFFIDKNVPCLVDFLNISQICIIGGEVMLRGDTDKILDSLREYTDKLVVFTKGSSINGAEKLVDGEPDQISTVVPTFDANKYAELSGGHSIEKVLHAIQFLSKNGRDVEIITMDSKEPEKEPFEGSIPIHPTYMGLSEQCKNCKTLMLTYDKDITICPLLRPTKINLDLCNLNYLNLNRLEELHKIKKSLSFKVEKKIKIFLKFNGKEISEEDMIILETLSDTNSFKKASYALCMPTTTLHYKVKKIGKRSRIQTD